jgi:hypothetical protein
MKILMLILSLACVSVSVQARTTTVTLAWDSPSVSSNIVAYKLFYGQVSQPLTNSVTTSSSVRAAALTLRTSTTYTFFCVAIDSAGIASKPSNYVTYKTRRR